MLVRDLFIDGSLLSFNLYFFNIIMPHGEIGKKNFAEIKNTKFKLNIFFLDCKFQTYL